MEGIATVQKSVPNVSMYVSLAPQTQLDPSLPGVHTAPSIDDTAN